MKQFTDLGQEIEKLWLATNYNEAHFPAIAADALKRADLPLELSAWDVVEWSLKEYELPRQRDLNARFADPPITVYSGLRFQIDVYFWFEGTTATHEHAFCGAFQVLMGSSIHSWYEFETREVINSFCELGEMSLKVCELLNVGNVQEIWAGKGYVHALFHLEQPSATIVIRTDRSPLNLPQFSYHKPGFAIDPFFEQDTLIKKYQMLSTLYRASRPDADEQAAAMLEKCDVQTAYNILFRVRHLLRSNQLGQMFDAGGSRERFEKLLGPVVERHGAAGEAIRGVFKRDDVVDDIMGRRGYVSDPEQRFFMALLLNVEGREKILDLVKARFPDADPVEKVLDWTFDLSQIRIFGGEGNNALGVADFGDAELDALEQVLKGAPIEEIRASHPDAAAKIESSTTFRPLLV
jgi:hypothetical protein